MSPVFLAFSVTSKKYIKNFRFYLSLALASFVWLVFMSSQPHKEERFMYPIYPFILVLSSVVLEKLYSSYPKISYLLILSVAAFSLSRNVQQVRAYSAPLQVWDYNFGNSKVCVGREWHRYPSSYFLDQVDLHYYEDGFKGILPTTFTTTDTVPKHMNNLNLEEPDRYVDLNSCDYAIDVDLKSSPMRQELKQWQDIKSAPFLDKDSTAQPFRSFYIPVAKKETMGRYLLLKNPRKN